MQPILAMFSPAKLQSSVIFQKPTLQTFLRLKERQTLELMKDILEESISSQLFHVNKKALEKNECLSDISSAVSSPFNMPLSSAIIKYRRIPYVI